MNPTSVRAMNKKEAEIKVEILRLLDNADVSTSSMCGILSHIVLECYKEFTSKEAYYSYLEKMKEMWEQGD